MSTVLITIIALFSLSALACEQLFLNSTNLLTSPLSSRWSPLTEDKFSWELSSDILKSKPGHFGADLISTRSYNNFILSFDFQFSQAANSGIKYLIQEAHGNIGLEYQIIDDQNHEDTKTAKTQTAALYDIFAPTDKKLSPYDQMNHGCIVFQDGKGEHWLNGKKVLSYDLTSQEFQDAVMTSKFKTFPWFGTYRSGKILIQHHGDQVFFKNLKIYDI